MAAGPPCSRADHPHVEEVRGARNARVVVAHRLLAQVDFPAGGVARFLTLYRDLSLSRDFVSSGYLLAIADIPFLALYLLVIGIIAWPLLIVALLLVIAYTATGFLLQERANRLGRESEKQTTRKLTYMGEMLASFDVTRTVPGAGTLLRNWRDLSDSAASLAPDYLHVGDPIPNEPA